MQLTYRCKAASVLLFAFFWRRRACELADLRPPLFLLLLLLCHVLCEQFELEVFGVVQRTGERDQPQPILLSLDCVVCLLHRLCAVVVVRETGEREGRCRA